MFQVLDNGRPADCRYFHCQNKFHGSLFHTFLEARNYANEWLGFNIRLTLNRPHDYSGYGNYIEIRKTEERSN